MEMVMVDDSDLPQKKGIDIMTSPDRVVMTTRSWRSSASAYHRPPDPGNGGKAIESVDRLCNGRKIAAKVLLVTLVIRERASKKDIWLIFQP